jgi:rare lipoprotein A
LLAEDPSLRGGSVGRSSINPAEVIVGGKEHDVLTNAATVEELLSAMGNAPDGDARVLPPPSTPIHSGIVIHTDRLRTVQHTVVRRIPFRVDETYTTDLDPGTIEVNRPGRVGRGRYTYETEIVNGKEVSRKLVSSTIIKKPVSEQRTFGEVVPVDTQAKAHPIYGTKDSETGQASWYDPPWSGLTAANKTLALGTQVTVTNLANGKSVAVTIDDRGPYGPGRVIDLSPEAFSQISDLGTGVLNVRISW